MTGTNILIWRKSIPVFDIWVPVRAQGKERHDKNNRSTLKTRMYEREVLGGIFRDAYSEREPWDKLVGVTAELRLRSRATKPDVDNCVKSLYDAMQGIVFNNDSQIVYEEISQTFCDEQFLEGMKIEVKLQW